VHIACVSPESQDKSTSSQMCAQLLPLRRAKIWCSWAGPSQHALLLIQENRHTRIKPTHAHSIRESTELTNHLSLPFLVSKFVHIACVSPESQDVSTSSQMCAQLLPLCRAKIWCSWAGPSQHTLLLIQENRHTRIRPTNAHSIRESTDGQFHSQFTIPNM